jgi:hypothetical protein
MSTPRICPSCNNYLFDDEAPKCVCANNRAPEPARPSEGAVTCSGLVAESEAALALLCKVRDALKLEADSSDYHRVSLLTDRFGAFVARRCHSATNQVQQPHGRGKTQPEE